MVAEPKVIKEKRIGWGQAGTHMYTVTDPDGTTAKEIKDSCIAQKPLAPPPGAKDAVVLGGVQADVLFSLDYRPFKDGDRLTSSIARIKTVFTELVPGLVDDQKPSGPKAQ